MITIWKKDDGCAGQYICASVLYLMSVMLQCYSFIIDWGISVPGNGKEFADGLNAISKRYIYWLMYNVELTGQKLFDS